MPVTPTYPGVYIEEIPSGVRTITGVATSITAFVGRAQRGPVNQPVTITSYADFIRSFGGLWLGGTMGYAVRDFYLNGGTTAIIVRVIHSGDATPQERREGGDHAGGWPAEPPGEERRRLGQPVAGPSRPRRLDGCRYQLRAYSC